MTTRRMRNWMYKFTAFIPYLSLIVPASNNVALYQDYSREEVTEALRMAGVYETILKLPKGQEEEIQENGKNFSGGELQRIALARLF